MAERLTDKKKKEIIAYYVECQNFSETARRFNIADMTVRRLVEKDGETLEKVEQKNKENTKSVLEAMDERRDKKIRLLDKILDAMENITDSLDKFTNIKDLATVYGIIMDKELKIRELDMKGKGNQDALEKLDKLLEEQKNA